MSDQLKQLVAGFRKLEKGKLHKAFDPFHSETRPNKKQQEIMEDINSIQYRYVVAGNQSGKSQLAAREIAWILTDTHPTWQRPQDWGHEPLLILVAAQDLTMAETELWGKKIKPFLDSTEWREERQGNSLKRALNKKTGDTIVFLSHSDGGEKNRRHMQGYVAHYVWLDEMPANAAIFEELQRRVDKNKGPWIATFTPKFRNDKIRRVVDASVAPMAKKYQMSKLDNPIYKERIEEEIGKLAGYTEAEKKTVLYGEWSTGEATVYHFDYEKMVIDSLPEYYSRGWRHVESVDPAMKSKFGYTLWAEDPSTGVWYLVEDTYIEGMLDVTDLIEKVKQKGRGYNIIRRISDSMAWFTMQANREGLKYIIPYDKNSRKNELIKGLQQALSLGKIKIGSWCATFIDEVQSCRWAETSDRIINASIYHTLDCSQYFCDMMPKSEDIQKVQPWHIELRNQNTQIKKQEKEKKKIASMCKIKRRTGRPINAWGKRNTGRKF